jgi:hypothetical protein
MNRKHVEDFMSYCMEQDDIPVDGYTSSTSHWFKDGDEWFPIQLILDSEYYTQWKESVDAQ